MLPHSLQHVILFCKRLFAYLWRERLPLLILLGFFVFAAVVVMPLRDVPVNDDWTYAWSVEHWVQTGSLCVLDWSAHYPIFQTLWGGLWVFCFGFSFGVLRLATATMGVLGCMALYLLLREFALDRTRSLLGAMLLATNPIYFVLSFTFMTDVYFLSLLNGALLCYVVGIKREQPGWLWLGGLFAVAAFLARQIGIVIPLCLLPSLWSKEGSWQHFWRRWWPMVAPLAVAAGLWLWLGQSIGRTTVMAEKLQSLQYLTSISWLSYGSTNIELFHEVSFTLFPLLVAGVSWRPRWLPWTIVACIVGSAGLWWWGAGSIPSPIPGGMTWNRQELADVRGLIQGAIEAPESTWVDWLTRVLMLSAVAILLVHSVRQAIQSRGKISLPGRVLLLSGLLQLGIINGLWLYYDRYYLVLLPTLIPLCLKVVPQGRFFHGYAISCLSLLAALSLSGTWDVLRFNQACLDACRALEARGVPAAAIDAGYSLNGGRLYAHPENQSPGETPEADVPWITSKKDLPYIIANRPLPGYEILQEISWRGSLWAISHRIYVLHRAE